VRIRLSHWEGTKATPHGNVALLFYALTISYSIPRAHPFHPSSRSCTISFPLASLRAHSHIQTDIHLSILTSTMAPRKQPKGPTAKKASTRRAVKATTATKDTIDQNTAAGKEQELIPFPYEVKRATRKDTIIGHLETEVAKHHDTALQLKEALEELERLKGGSGMEQEAEAGGDMEKEQEDMEEDLDDAEGDDGEQWNGISQGQLPDAGNGMMADKVQSLETAMNQFARGLRDVTTTVNRSFQELAAGINKEGTTQPSQIVDVDGDYDVDGDGFATSGGKSDWHDLMARFDTAGEKDMLSIAKGEIMPEKIYLCIPRDSDFFPDTTDETKDKLRWDEEGPYLEKKDSAPYDKTKVFRNLAKAVTSPMHFQHAWGWFMVLVNYHYKDADLNSAMMQFGAEVVQYDGIYKWEDCLKVYVNLARPILRGNLDQRVKLFKEANFAAALSKCQRVERLRVPMLNNPQPAFASNLVRPAPPPVFIEGVEVCRRFNKGLCSNPCMNGRRHACLNCRNPAHKAFQCPVPGSGDNLNSGQAVTTMAQRPPQSSTGFQPRNFGQNNHISGRS
jgi:predicted nucleic acid-binding protein